MRHLLSFTIDGRDAKDFDDSVSLEQLENGNVLLGVHIADVGHYVKPGTALDREAFARGTSVYLPGRVLPMLPEQQMCIRDSTDADVYGSRNVCDDGFMRMRSAQRRDGV